jgi:hypothetical protein
LIYIYYCIIRFIYNIYGGNIVGNGSIGGIIGVIKDGYWFEKGVNWWLKLELKGEIEEEEDEDDEDEDDD